MTYKQLNEAKTKSWVASLLDEEKSTGSAKLQDELVRIARFDKPIEFADYVEKAIAASSENENAYEFVDKKVPQIDKSISFTEGHMERMPPKDMISFYRQLEELPIDIASWPYFWGSLTLDLIKKERIYPSWLVYGNSSLEKAEPGKQRNRLVRRIIRSMIPAGLYRGSPELFADCSLARAYWCCKLAEEIAERSGSNFEDIAYTLAGIWRTIADYLAGNFPSLRETNVISGMVEWIFTNEEKVRSTETVQDVSRLTSRLTGYIFLDSYPYKNVKEIIGTHLDKHVY